MIKDNKKIWLVGNGNNKVHFLAANDLFIAIEKSFILKANNIKFVGNVSLENNGGFASCRMGYNGSQLKGSTKFLLRVKGDGNIYKLRFRIGGSYANYSADFSTIKDEWVDIEIPIEDFKPYYFGRKTRAPRFKIHKINSLGILISDKQSGSFSLEIEHLKAL